MYTRAIPAIAASLVLSMAVPANAESVASPLTCGDVNNTGGVTSSDALAVLRLAVGQAVDLACKQCPLAIVEGVTEAVAASSNFYADYLLGGPVEIGGTMVIAQFGILSRSDGSHVRIGLYTDEGGKPSTLVIGTDSTEIFKGSQVIPVFPTEVQAGTYWIMAVYDVDTLLPGDDEDKSTPVVYRDWDFEDPLPDSFDEGSTYSGQPMPYYLQGVPSF